MSMYDDFFEEPSEFEIQIEEFKQALVKEVKAEYKERMAKLEKENAELREFRDAKAEYEHKLNMMELERDAAIKRAQGEAERKSLKKIFGENLTSGYRVSYKNIKYKKCDRCDEGRRIRYKNPLGQDRVDTCVCDQTTVVYIPKEVKLVSFYANKDREQDNRYANLYYERVGEERDYDRYDLAGDVYKGEEFEAVNWYRAVFFDFEKCKEYCEWLKVREEEQSKVYMKQWGLSIEQEVE